MTETLVRLKNRLSDDEFFDLCQMNELRMERLSDRSIIIKPFNSLISSNFIVEVSAEIYTWNRKVRMGKCFASCTGFTFPNKAVFSPNFS